MATLKKLTRVGADVRQIARLLQSKAPEGHMLAYITPDEAKLLKSQGGSGKLHENTGIPSFENEFSYDMYGENATPSYTPQYETNAPEFQTAEPMPVTQITGTDLPPAAPYVANKTASAYPSGFDVPVGADRFSSAPASQPDFAGQSRIGEGEAEIPYMPPGAFPAGAYAPPEGGAGRGYEAYQIDTAREEPSIGEKLQQYYKDMKPETLQRLGLAGGLGLLGAYQSNKAQKEAERAKKEQQALAAPYQQKGAELQRAAQAGELTPAAQQQLQAVQAQAAQQAASRGGAVGQAQTQAQIEAFRSQLLAQQYDYGLKLSGIGDQVALGAIKTGLEADRYVQSLSNGFYTNMANIVGGMPAQPQRTA